MGETAVFTGEAVATFTRALTDCEVCRLDMKALRGLLNREPSPALELLAHLAGHLRDAEARLGAEATSSVGRRLADRLLQLSDLQGGDVVTLPSTRRDLAAWLGTTPETLSRRLGRLQDDGLLRVLPDGRLLLLDRKSLALLPPDA